MNTPESNEALAWLDEALAAEETDRAITPYLDAAAVLMSYNPNTLQPFGSPSNLPREDALLEVMSRSRPVGRTKLGRWQLCENDRRVALQRLGTLEKIRQARAANPGENGDPAQSGFDLLLQPTPPDLRKLSLEELLGMQQAANWLESLVPPTSLPLTLAARIEHERLLAPMRKLSGRGFVDREDDRARLADYVGVLPPGSIWRGIRRTLRNASYLIDERPPLHLFGPGGMGKSALLARFILDHADARHSQPLPFVYLDFDRSVLDPTHPDTLLAEAIRQLLIQFPNVSAQYQSLGAQSRESTAARDDVDVAKSSHFETSNQLLQRFCGLVSEIAAINDQPVLFVLDTLEEAEYQGTTALTVTWNLLSELMRNVDHLRIVTAGRSELPGELPRKPVEVKGLPVVAAEQLVVERTATLPNGPVSKADARKIVELTGTVPFSLTLAAQVVLNEGLAGLESAIGRRQLFSRIKTEQQQGMLYRRILGHVRVHDPELEKVANPGLILRRITVDIIKQVLAGPCKLDLTDPTRAKTLFDDLAKESGLVDANREPNALWHLTAVRRVMLPELRATLGPLAREIHEAAVTFYTGKKGDIPEAELLYHRLWLEDDPRVLEPLWRPELDTHLRSAYDELEPAQKIWLGDKLKRELDPQLRSQADYAVWERQTEKRAQTLMSNGLLTEALAALRERPRPSRPSLLDPLEIDILKLLGRFAEADKSVRRALELAGESGDRRATLPLLLRASLLAEITGDFESALTHATEALSLARDLRDSIEILSADAACVRLRRKIKSTGGSTGVVLLDVTVPTPPIRNRWLSRRTAAPAREPDDKETTRLKSEMVGQLKQPEVRAQLRSRPALLQEAAAEIGRQDVDLLVEAVALLGVSASDFLALRQAAGALGQELNEEQAGLLKQLSASSTSRGLGRDIARLVPAFADFFVERLMQSVEDSLRRTVVKSGKVVGEFLESTLDNWSSPKLADAIAKAFTADDLHLLARDTLDLDFREHLKKPIKLQVATLLDHAAKQDALGKFVTALSRSRPNDVTLRRAAEDFGGPAVL